MKKTIKINFPELEAEGCKEWILSLLDEKFNVELDKDYDYYFVSELVYLRPGYMKEVLKSCKSDCILIYSGGEAIYPDLNIFDYVIGMTLSHIMEDDRVINIPFLMAQERNQKLFHSVSELDNSKRNISARRILDDKTKFCNFIYGNSNAHKMRDDLFYAISKYKQVDSLGRHLKNVDIVDTRQDEEWGKISIRLKAPYKFSIAAENACFAGYSSEKLVTSMMANTIPIYWGDPYINELYNPRSFIDAADYQSLDELAAYIAKIDQDDDLWCEIMSEPWRTQEQMEQFYIDVEKFYRSFYGIFEKDVEDARRRPRRSPENDFYIRFFQ